MRRARRSRPQLNLSLFPFLAVLICTMGVLIVLLVIVVKHADLHADEVKEQQTAKLQQQQTDIEIANETAEVRIALLTDVRAKVNEELREKQQVRSNIQSHINQLRKEAEQIKARYLRMTNLNTESDASAAAEITQQIAAVEAQTAAANQELERVSHEAKQVSRSFAIIPYHGAGGTYRRPIFVECTAKAIILQPYGIELTPEDFDSPLMAGNPLDAALLTIRDYLHSHAVDRKRDQPYPLMIVRPDGAVGYAMARRAMKSWVDQFGYELIPAEMQLSYPPTDENLRKEIEKSVQAARIRMNAIKQAAERPVSLAEIANNQYGSRYADGTQVNSGRATFPHAGGPSGLNQPSQMLASSGNSGGSASSSGQGFDADENSIDQTGNAKQGFGTGTGGSNQNNPQARSSEFTGNATAGSPVGSSMVSSGLGGDGNTQSGTSANDNQASYVPRDQSGPNENDANSALSSQSTFGKAQSNGSQTSGLPSADGTAGGLASMSGPQSGGAGGNQPAFGQQAGSSANLTSLSAQRGKDWALPDKTPNATVYRRQIFMQCSNQELSFRAVNRVQAGGESIAFEKPTSEHIDELIDLVWRRVESWGVAGVRSYWKPQLMIEVQKGGETRAAEIQKLLEESGLDVLLIKL